MELTRTPEEPNNEAFVLMIDALARAKADEMSAKYEAEEAKWNQRIWAKMTLAASEVEVTEYEQYQKAS